MKTMLAIGAVDPTGGAGVLADVRVACRFGVYGMAVVTAVTSQNPVRFNGMEAVSEEMFEKQIEDVMGHYRVDAVKCGMIAEKWQLRVLRRVFENRRVRNLVIDPIASATLGEREVDEETVRLYGELFRMARIVTPNEKEARIFGEIGSEAVLWKGGESEGEECVDVLEMGGRRIRLASAKVLTRNTHGTGCTMGAAIASCLALGMGVEEAVRQAHRYVARAIKGAVEWDITEGYGPVNHFVEI